MKKLLFACMLLFVLVMGAAPAVSQTVTSSGDAESVAQFNRDLVNQVKKGCVYIWAMSPGTSGFLAPRWIGSGVIFMAVPEEDAAYAITNHHVAQDTTLLQVETWDRATYKAQFVALEPGIDCALIRIENIPRDRYEPCVLGNSDEVMIGELSLAVGAPGSAESGNTERSDPSMDFGLHQTTTMRVVTGRLTDPYQLISWWSGWQQNLGRQVLTNCAWRFVTESPISGGNSGGPLFNSAGEVIGLNHAHFGAGAAITQHENYTIPVNFCKNFAFQILDTGKYEIPWFGMDLLMPSYFDDGYAVGEFMDRYLDPEKIEVFGVRKGSPAAAVDIEKGDTIVEFDGRVFADVGELRMYIFSLPIGKMVPITLKRGKREVDVMVEVGVKRSYNSEFSM